MDFITYILFDFVGTVQGLDVGSYIANALKEGNIITPIIALFTFLSIMRISYALIAEKNYSKAGKDGLFLAIFIALFAVNGNFKIWYVNITKGIYDASFLDQLNVGLDLYPDVNNQSVTVTDVPFMYSILSVSDQFAYLTGKLILDKNAMKENILKKHLRLYPQDVVSLGVIQYVSKADSIQNLAKRIKEVANCFNVDETIKEKLKRENLSEGEKEILEELYSELKRIPSVIDIFGFTNINTLNRCQEIRENVAFEIKALSDNVFGVSPTGNDAIFKQFIDGLADAITQGYIPVETQKQILNGLLMQKHIIAGLNNYYASLRGNSNALITGIEKLKSKFDYTASNIIQSRTFYEWFMFKIQSIVIFILLALFPIIIAIAFLPVFGYNFKLLFTYVFSYFLVKLWLPIYFIAYQFLTGKMFIVLSNAVAFILPKSAYAGTLEIYTALATSIPETTKFANLILNSLAMAIPTALGGGALILIGRDFYTATQKSIAESVLTAKMVGFMLSRGFSTGPNNPDNRLGGGGASIGASGSNETVTMTQTLKGGGVATYPFKESKNGTLLIEGKLYNLGFSNIPSSQSVSKDKFDNSIIGKTPSGIYIGELLSNK